MFGSVVLEVGLGLAFVFLLVALVCSGLQEVCARLVNLRARTLRAGVETMLADPALVEQIFEHPLVAALGIRRTGVGARRSPFGWLAALISGIGAARIEHIPAHTFARVLVDVLEPEKLEQSDADSNETLDRALRSLLRDVEGRAAETARRLGEWFDDTMSGTSRLYQRTSQRIILLIALAVVGVLNIDSIEIARRMLSSASFRQVLVAVAESAQEPGADASATMAQSMDQLRDLDILVPWADDPFLEPRRSGSSPGEDPLWRPLGGWWWKIVGLLLTASAATLGAPFWFDVLRRLAGLRKTAERSQADTDGAAA